MDKCTYCNLLPTYGKTLSGCPICRNDRYCSFACRSNDRYFHAPQCYPYYLKDYMEELQGKFTSMTALQKKKFYQFREECVVEDKLPIINFEGVDSLMYVLEHFSYDLIGRYVGNVNSHSVPRVTRMMFADAILIINIESERSFSGLYIEL